MALPDDRQPAGRSAGSDSRYTCRMQESISVPGLKLTAGVVTVPLDYRAAKGPSIDVFFRLATSCTNTKTEEQYYLLYLQGGPGHEAGRPTESSGWLSKAVQYFTVVLLDQRGTGCSAPVSAQSLVQLGGPEQQAAYLQHFRADNIIRDAEAVRESLLGPTDRWSIMGQSFGGFCCLRYLSASPQSALLRSLGLQDGLSEVLITGGIPPGIDLPCSAYEAYKRLYRRVITQNKKFYTRFPGDVAAVQRLVAHLASLPGGGAPLPNGGTLTPRALQLLGLNGLGGAGGFERLHFLLERSFDGTELSPHFLLSFQEWMPWAINPLYAILHESIYCQGECSDWAASRVLRDHFASAFDPVGAACEGRPVYFTGEMVFPWMFEDFVELRPLKPVADALAAKRDWPQLYNVSALEKNDVPVAAACYYEDMYVDFDMAQDTARHLGGLRQWVTSEFMHSGIREDGPRIFETLLGMTRGSRPLF